MLSPTLQSSIFNINLEDLLLIDSFQTPKIGTDFRTG